VSADERQNGAGPELVTVSIDGREFRAEAGRNMLDVALSRWASTCRSSAGTP
jgi:hypothetical protein